MDYTHQFKAKCLYCKGDIWTGIKHEKLLTKVEAEAMGEDSETSWMPYTNSNSACECSYAIHEFGTVRLIGIEDKP